MGGGVGADYASTTNLANSGNFSVQVLTKAMQAYGGYDCVPLNTYDQSRPDKTKSLGELVEGFICHKGDHWISLRKVHGQWYNLNSTNIVPPGPQYISDFQLDAFLGSLKGNNFIIYVVQSPELKPLPVPKMMEFPPSMLRKNQMYIKV